MKIKDIFLSKLSATNSELDIFIGRFMDIKEKIGNGVGAGKLFENLFSGFINEKIDGMYAIHLNLSNSFFIWDIIVTDNKNALIEKERIKEIIRNGDNIENEISNVLGDKWIGVSLKTYKEDACQITTDYSYRTYLEEVVGDGEISLDKIDEFQSLLNKHDQDRYLIMGLNTYDNSTAVSNEVKSLKLKLKRLKNPLKIKETNDKINNLMNYLENGVLNNYTFRILSFDKKFDKISYKKNKKLSQYDLSIEGVNYFKVLYGKNQANAFQRGIWTHNNKSIEYFTLIKSGRYKTDNYFERAILSTIYK